jgi:hypothetical protein
MKVSTTGYKRNSKDKKHKQLYIPGDVLTMLGVDDYVSATPQYPDGSLGQTTTMTPGTPRISFPGAVGVIEKKLPQVNKNSLPKAQYVGGIEYLGDVTQDEDNYWEQSYNKWIGKNLSFNDAYNAATADVNARRGPSHPYYVYNANSGLPNENSGVIVPAQKPNPYKHLQDWSDFNQSGSAQDFYGNTDDAVKWEKQWYSGRATLPQFKDIAEKRLSLADSIEMQPWSTNNWQNSRSPYATGYYSWADATVNIPQFQFSRPSIYTHERSHWYDYNAPQDNMVTSYYKGKPIPLYNEYDRTLGDIIPEEYMIPGGEGATNDVYSKESIYTPFTNDDPNYNANYYYNPTEVRARLNEWRRRLNIDPTKNYTNEEIQQIIDNDINSGDPGSFDLYKVLRGRGDLLKQINDSYVSTGNKENPDEMPKAQLGIIDDIFKRRALKKYPAMQNVYGPKGENLNIIRDKNFDASSHGFGDIEFVFPGSGTVNYSDDYTYQSPTPDKYTAVYNPKGAGRGDVFLDMLHGMRDDPGYQQGLQNFGTAVRNARGKDMDYYYDRDVSEGWSIDGRETWDKSYIDGMLRAELSQYTPGRVSGESDYKIERSVSSSEMQKAAMDIYNYLRTEPQKLDTKKQGGSLDKYQIQGPVKPRIGLGVGYEQTPTEFGLHLNPKNIELPPMAPIAGAVPYAMQTSVVGAPNQWLPLPDWSESPTYKAELDNTNNRQNFEGYVQNMGDGKMSTSFPVDMPAWMLPQVNVVEKQSRAGKYAKEFMTQHPNPDDWEDGRDPNSPVTESLLGNMLGIGKTATNPYTGEGWSYYNRKTNWQNAKDDYIAMKLLGENPQGGRSRQEWLASFNPGELDILSKSRKYSGEIAANRWAEGLQGLVNSATTGVLSPGAGIINLLPESMRPSAPNLFEGQLSEEEAKDANILNGIGMLAIPAEGVKGWITEGDSRGWAGASPIDYTGGRDLVADIAGEVVMDPLNLTGIGILKGLRNVHAGILDDIITKSVQEAGKLNINPVETFVRHAQREGIIPAGVNVQTLIDNPNLLNTVVTRGVKNNLTVGRRVTPSAGAGVAESASGTITDLAKGDAAALSRFTGDPVGEAFYMGTHIPRDAYGMRSGLQSLPYDLDALYFDAPGKFARQTRATPNNYGDFTITSRIPFEYTTDPQQMVADYLRRLETAKPMSGGVGAKPGDLFGKLHGVGANESAIVGKPGQQVLEPVSVSTIADYNKPLDEFDDLFKLSREDPEKFKAAFWEKANSGQLARTKQELGLSEDAMFLDPLYGIGDNPTLNELRFALRADANNKQLALAANAPIQKTNFSPLTMSFGNSAPVELTASQANRRLATAQKQFDVLSKRGYENLSLDELLDAFRLEHEIKNLSTQVNKSTGTTAQVVDDAGRVGASDEVLGLPESRYKKMMEFFTMPDSKSKSGQNMLAEFQQRVKTEEGQRRLKELGISNPHIFEGLVIKEMQNELGYFNSNSGLEFMALHKDIPEEIAAKITRHELEHAVQRALGRKSIPDPNNPRIPWLAKPANTTEIDDILGNLTFKGKPSSTFTPRLHSEEPIVFPANHELFPSAQRNLDYFVHGSQGKERSAFLAEVQQSLVDDKLIDDVYQNITPEKVEEAYNLYMKNISSDKYPLRLFDIIEPTQKNFQDISTGLNKMLGLTGVGLGIGVATQQKKKGGPVNKRNHKDLDNYFTQAWSKSRKTA